MRMEIYVVLEAEILAGWWRTLVFAENAKYSSGMIALQASRLSEADPSIHAGRRMISPARMEMDGSDSGGSMSALRWL